MKSKNKKIKLISLFSIPLISLSISVPIILTSCSESNNSNVGNSFSERTNEIYFSNYQQIDPTATSNWVKIDENFTYLCSFHPDTRTAEIGSIIVYSNYNGAETKILFPSKVKDVDGDEYVVTGVNCDFVNDNKKFFENITDVYFDPEINNNLSPQKYTYSNTIYPFKGINGNYNISRKIQIKNQILGPVFKNFYNLQRIHNFPNRITFIPDDAFRNCLNLLDFSFLQNSDVKYIGSYAFAYIYNDFNGKLLPNLPQGQAQFRKFYFPKNLICIFNNAFDHFPFEETKLSISSTVKFIGTQAFVQQLSNNPNADYFKSNIEQIEFLGTEADLDKRFIDSFAFNLYYAWSYYLSPDSIPFDLKRTYITEDSFRLDELTSQSFKHINGRLIKESDWPEK